MLHTGARWSGESFHSAQFTCSAPLLLAIILGPERNKGIFCKTFSLFLSTNSFGLSNHSFCLWEAVCKILPTLCKIGTNFTVLSSQESSKSNMNLQCEFHKPNLPLTQRYIYIYATLILHYIQYSGHVFY